MFANISALTEKKSNLPEKKYVTRFGSITAQEALIGKFSIDYDFVNIMKLLEGDGEAFYKTFQLTKYQLQKMMQDLKKQLHQAKEQLDSVSRQMNKLAQAKSAVLSLCLQEQYKSLYQKIADISAQYNKSKNDIENNFFQVFKSDNEQYLAADYKIKEFKWYLTQAFYQTAYTYLSTLTENQLQDKIELFNEKFGTIGIMLDANYNLTSFDEIYTLFSKCTLSEMSRELNKFLIYGERGNKSDINEHLLKMLNENLTYLGATDNATFSFYFSLFTAFEAYESQLGESLFQMQNNLSNLNNQQTLQKWNDHFNKLIFPIKDDLAKFGKTLNEVKFENNQTAKNILNNKLQEQVSQTKTLLLKIKNIHEEFASAGFLDKATHFFKQSCEILMNSDQISRPSLRLKQESLQPNEGDINNALQQLSCLSDQISHVVNELNEKLDNNNNIIAKKKYSLFKSRNSLKKDNHNHIIQELENKINIVKEINARLNENCYLIKQNYVNAQKQADIVQSTAELDKQVHEMDQLQKEIVQQQYESDNKKINQLEQFKKIAMAREKHAKQWNNQWLYQLFNLRPKNSPTQLLYNMLTANCIEQRLVYFDLIKKYLDPKVQFINENNINLCIANELDFHQIVSIILRQYKLFANEVHWGGHTFASPEGKKYKLPEGHFQMLQVLKDDEAVLRSGKGWYK